MSETTVEVRGKFTTPELTNATGTVTFTPRILRAYDTAERQFLSRVAVTATLEAGAFAVDLLATDDPDRTPVGWTYKVVVRVEGSKYDVYDIEVPLAAAADGIDLGDVAPVVTSEGSVFPIPGPQGEVG